MEGSQNRPANLHKILEEAQVGREEPLSENTAGFGD